MRRKHPRTRFPAWLLALCLLPVAARPAAAQAVGAPGASVVYEVGALDGKLLHLLPAGDERLATGDRLAGGAEVRTGWLSSADLAVPRAAARFHLESRTHAVLGAENPSVLLVLDRGRLRALFDKLGEAVGGGKPGRRVRTPSAILAVRGTAYGVAVGRHGGTTLVVFEGVVDVTPLPALAGPQVEAATIRVRAGEALHVRDGQPLGPPLRHGLTPEDWDRGAMPSMSAPPAGVGDSGRGAGPATGQDRGQGPERVSEPQNPQGQQGPPPQSTTSGGSGSALVGAQSPDQSPGQSQAQSPGQSPSQPPDRTPGAGPAPAPGPAPSPAPSPAPGPAPGPEPGAPPAAPAGPPPGGGERAS